MNRDSILGLLRHALTTAGGALVAQGGISDSEVTAVAGSIVTIVGVLWSVAEKRRRTTGPQLAQTPTQDAS